MRSFWSGSMPPLEIAASVMLSPLMRPTMPAPNERTPNAIATAPSSCAGPRFSSAPNATPSAPPALPTRPRRRQSHAAQPQSRNISHAVLIAAPGG